MASQRTSYARGAKMVREDQKYANRLIGHQIKRLNDRPTLAPLIRKLQSTNDLNAKDIIKLKNLTGILVNKDGDHAVYVWKGDLYDPNDDSSGMDRDGFDTKNYKIVFGRPLLRRPEGRNLHAETGCEVQKGVCALISQQLGKWIRKQSADGLGKWQINALLSHINGEEIYKFK